MHLARWILLGVVLCSLGAVTTDTATLTVSAPVASNWPVIEAACESLGSGCLLSEPLDEPTGPTNENRASQTAGGVPASPFDCDGSPGTNFEPVPAPLNGVTNALHFDASIPGSFSSCDMSVASPIDFTHQTIAFRLYEYMDSSMGIPDGDGSLGGGTERIKSMRIEGVPGEPHPGFQSSSQTQCDPGTPAACEMNFDMLTFSGTTFENDSNRPEVFNATWAAPNGKAPFVELFDTWVRIEVAFTHYPIGHANQNQLFATGRIVRLSDGKTWQMDPGVLGNTPQETAIISNIGAKPMMLDTPNGITANRWASAVVGVMVPPDDTFFIGPACEIEGCP